MAAVGVDGEMYIADHHAAIHARLKKIQSAHLGSRSDTPNLREAIEGLRPWWPVDLVTDGADHFVIRRPRTSDAT